MTLAAHPLVARLERALAGRAPQLAELSQGFSHVLAPSTTFGKDLLPRAAALAGCPQVSDLMAVVEAVAFQRLDQRLARARGLPHREDRREPGAADRQGRLNQAARMAEAASATAGAGPRERSVSMVARLPCIARGCAVTTAMKLRCRPGGRHRRKTGLAAGP